MKPFRSFLFAACILSPLLAWLNPGSATLLPQGFSEETVGSGWDGVAGVATGPNANGTKRRVYGWEASGKVWIVEDGVRLPNPLVDITAEIGPELSLLGFALDPAFQTNGYLYLLYTVDRNALLGSPGRAPSVGRLVRYTCRRDTDFTSVETGRKVLIGETKSTGIPIIERSHGVGALAFAADGTLLVSCGDGAGGSETEIDTGNSPNALQAVADGILPATLNIGAWRSQSLDSLSGKILRIDPETGDGIAGNPFYQSGSPRSSRSRVWAYGLRNPYRFAIKPGTGSPNRNDAQPGTIVFGEAGWNTADSLFVCTTGGQNFGWPAFEGFDPAPGYKDVTPPAFVNTANRIPPVSSWTPTGARVRSGGSLYSMGAAGNPVAGTNYSGRASIGGTFIDSASWPSAWAGCYLHLDWGLDDNGAGGWVRGFPGVETGTISSVDAFGSDWFHVSHLFFDKPSSELYYIIWPNIVKRVVPDAAPPGPVDTTPPAFTLYAPAVLETSGDFAVTMNISEAVSGLTASDFTVNNGTALSYETLETPLMSKVTIRPAANGVVTVSLPSGVCTDAAGNGNTAAAAVSTLIGSTQPPVDPPTTAAGLKMEVFRDSDLTTPAYTAIVPDIVNVWGDEGPRAGLTDHFSIRWTGQFTAPARVIKKFIVDSDDGVRLYMDGQLLIDSWSQPGTHWQQSSPAFITSPGRTYQVTLEYRDLTGFATAVLYGAGDDFIAPLSGFSHPTEPADTTPPVLTLAVPAEISSDRIDTPFTVSITPSEPISGLTASDFVLTGCRPDPMRGPDPIGLGNDGKYTLYLTAYFTPGITITLPQGVCTDAAGNPNTGSDSLRTAIRPLLALSVKPSDLAAELAVPPGDFTIRIASPFNLGDLTPASFAVSNGRVLSWSLEYGSRTGVVGYLGKVRPAAPGPVSVFLPAGALKAPGGGGPGSLASNTITGTYAPPGRPGGVGVRFFRDATLTTTAFETVVPNINFDWMLGSPGAGVPVDQFSARFTGWIIPPVSGALSFYVRADDGARLWLDGTLKFDGFQAEGGEWSAPFQATAGMPVAVKIEYREGWGGAGIGASWSGPGLAKQLIPSSRWLAQQGGVTFPLAIAPEEDAAAASSQIPAAWLSTVRALPEIGGTLEVKVNGLETALSWSCLEGARAWLLAESSINLRDWTPVPAQAISATPAAVAGMTELRLPVPGGPGPRYYRLRAVR